MSLYAVERLLHAMNSDPDLAERFGVDRAAVVDGEPKLTADQRRWLIDGDVLTMYRAGVHPLLLVQASRFFGMQPAEFHRALEPARGERTS